MDIADRVRLTESRMHSTLDHLVIVRQKYYMYQALS